VTKNNTIWVVEINFKDGKGWQATVGVGLTRDQGRREIKTFWRANNPDEWVRLRKYVRS
jgi:hypothetical protein